MPCAPLFQEEAEEGARYFGELRAVDVAGSPKLSEISRPWVMDWVKSIFGAYDPEEGKRLIREWFLLIAKKNAKSTNAAGVMMTALLLNWRQSGEFGILAPTIEVANNAYHPARDMVKADPELSALLHVQDHVRKITHRTTGATLQVVAADSETVAGKKWIGTFVDELWLFGGKPRAFKMLEEATGGMASRPEGFVIYASTQSDEQPAGVFKDKLAYARGVRDGRIHDPSFLPLIYEFPRSMVDDDSYRDRKNFYVPNPNLGASVDEAFIAHKLEQVNDAGEESLQTVLAKYLNVEIGLNLASDRWAGADFWDENATTVTFDELLERSDVIDLGIDGGGLDDLLGFAAVGRDRDTGEWLLWVHAWAHPSVLMRHKKIAPRLNDFVRDGDLTIVKSKNQDVTELAEYAARVEQSGLLDKVGVDQHGLGGILDALDEAGVPADKIIGISQGWKMVGAIKTTERRLCEGGLKHGGRPMMAWCVGNAKVEPKGNAIAITKQNSGSAKIDPLMATFNAVSLMGLNPQPATPQLFT